MQPVRHAYAALLLEQDSVEEAAELAGTPSWPAHLSNQIDTHYIYVTSTSYK
jgi:hypothetical protein